MKLIDALSVKYTRTENGALTYAGTLNKNLDYFAQAAATRGRNSVPLFSAAYDENPILALKNLFYLRDVRQGKGERKIFRDHLAWLYANDHDTFIKLIPFVAEFGRWDDLTSYVHDSFVVAYVREQLASDLTSKNPSLLGKWMPSENASSKETKALAMRWIVALGYTVREYRKMLSELRAKLRIVERYMSSRKWSAINYERVPSKAMTLYRKAFSKKDADRFVKYLEAVKKGEKKINSGVLYPYDIYNAYKHEYGTNAVLEEQWKALPDYINGNSFLVMADVSGSMSGQPMAVSVSLAIYAAERMRGQFKDHFLTFSGSPALIKLSGRTLKERMDNVSRANWDMNTNLQAAFNLVLSTAVKHNVAPEDMPNVIMVISDMEFDSACGNQTNLDAIRSKYKNAGYTCPILVFWNVNSRKNNVAALKSDLGVVLVSGASATIFKSALALQDLTATPEDTMNETLNVDRYAFVENL